MKRGEGGGSGPGARGPRAEERPGAARPAWRRPLALATPPSPAAGSAAGFRGACARDFEDFVEAEGGWATLQRIRPDPGFREGLRRRLWRIHVSRRAHRGFERN